MWLWQFKLWSHKENMYSCMWITEIQLVIHWETLDLICKTVVAKKQDEHPGRLDRCDHPLALFLVPSRYSSMRYTPEPLRNRSGTAPRNCHARVQDRVLRILLVWFTFHKRTRFCESFWDHIHNSQARMSTGICMSILFAASEWLKFIDSYVFFKTTVTFKNMRSTAPREEQWNTRYDDATRRSSRRLL